MEEDEPRQKDTRGRWRYGLGGFILLLAIAAGIAWLKRETIAASYIDDILAEAEIEGGYEIQEIGFGRQRIDNLVIGDPNNPDLTVDSAFIYLRYGLGYPEIRRVVARGVRINGRLVDGSFDFGQLNGLLPEPTGEPFSLPDMELELTDAIMRLQTPYGPVALAAFGSGALQNGFRGRLAAASPGLKYRGCEISAVRTDFAVAVNDRRPAIEGPARAGELSCTDTGFAMVQPQLALDAIFSESFRRWGGEAELLAASIVHAQARASATRLAVSFDGETGSQTTGTMRLSAAGASGQDIRAARTALRGHYRIRNGGGSIGFDGDVELVGAQAGDPVLDGLVAALRGAEGTPLGPVGTGLARALQAAGRNFDAQFAITGAYGEGGGAVRFAEIRGTSESGARVALERGEGLRYAWPDRGLRFDGAMRLAGGGFPQSFVTLDQAAAGAPLEGYAEIAPIRTGNAVLNLAPVRFTAAADGNTRIVTQIEMTGPLADGRVERLRMPVAGTMGRGGRLAFGEGCVPVRWDRLSVAGVTVGPTRLPFCPVEGGTLVRYAPGVGMSGGGRLIRPRLRGTLGGSPLSISAQDFRLPLGRPAFAANGVSVRLGPAGAQSELDIGRLAARFVTGGVDGEFSAAAGEIANVPIRLEDSSGDWRFVGGILQLNGVAGVTNDDPDTLFEPLVVRDMALRMESSLITMSGGLRTPEQDLLIANVSLNHDLRDGSGEAVLETDDLAFNDRLQPTDLTNLLLGIVAEVEGLVSGIGTIHWDAAGVTSDGVYQLTDVDLAAPFGPVRGLNSEVRFTDLLGMNTEPGQVATIREINPGVLVEDGRVRFELLSANRVRVEGARWPFAGGALILDPTILDFRVDQARELVFRVEGVDGFQFLESRDFENIVATGLFDGELPMVFDINGGRIEDGYLVSRAGGGTFSYVGEISDVNLGLFGSLAFNALELIRYSELRIDFDGAIDGEMVTNISFTGVSPNLDREGQGFIVGGFTRELAEIPIRFNIRMNAPFNQMLYSFRLLDDPGFLVNQAIRARINRIQAERDVQATESEDLP
ncbi:intermembrane phospholipid transport protein YdbH family protein [Parasphingopyxis lamellibrachiae]|uniref:Dicarboxylate transport n=1 Tax=Parasphingopyxis lamellibrachiae TaxID=680125 RepID=A0A3D9FDX1_9SPHN|nr:YdbH domain-containing protein [Parasphingopyxis lamellibrachiae]RED15953.1 dicarboxylate transport [Parasphingopyxis lamellibrachiae]